MAQEIGRIAVSACLAVFFASALFFSTVVFVTSQQNGIIGQAAFSFGIIANVLAFGAIALRKAKRFTAAMTALYMLFLFLSAVTKYFPSVVLHLMMLTFPVAWLVYAGKTSPDRVWAELRLHKRNLLLLAALGAFATIFVLYPLIIGQGILLKLAGIDDAGKVSQTILDAPIWLAAFSFLFAPISEEIFFRSFLYGRLRKLAGKILPGKAALAFAALATTALFAVAHYSYGSVAQILGAFTIGLIFMGVFILTDSLAAVIAAHAVFNFISVCIIYLADYFGAEVPVGLLF